MLGGVGLVDHSECDVEAAALVEEGGGARAGAVDAVIGEAGVAAEDSDIARAEPEALGFAALGRVTMRRQRRQNSRPRQTRQQNMRRQSRRHRKKESK